MNPPTREKVLLRCLACGSTWFREAEPQPYPQPEPIVDLRITLAVCLCGTPFHPTIGGLWSGPAANRALASFERSFESVEAWREKQDLAALGSRLHSTWASREDLAALREGLAVLERAIWAKLRRLHPGSLTGRRKPWREARRAAEHGFRDQLALTLQQQLSFRKARQAVQAVFAIWKAALARGEAVETPVGDIRVISSPAPRNRYRLGTRQILFKQPKKIAFERSCSWDVTPTEATPMKRPPSERPSTDPDQCERCGSIWFTRGEFRQYRAGIYTSVPGGELHYESNMAQRVRVLPCPGAHTRN